MNYLVRSEGDQLSSDALPANDKGDYVDVLLLRSDDEMAQANVYPNKFLDFFRVGDSANFCRLFDRELI